MADLGGMFGQGLRKGATAGIGSLEKEREFLRGAKEKQEGREFLAGERQKGRAFTARSRLDEIDRRTKAKKAEKKLEADAKAFKENMKDVGVFSDMVQLREGEVGASGEALDSSDLKKRFKQRLTAFWLSRTEGNKPLGPQARAEIDILVDTEISQLKAYAGSAAMSAGKGNFKLRTYLNLLNSPRPAAAEKYLETTVLEDVRAAGIKKDLALADKAGALARKAEQETKNLQRKNQIMQRIIKRQEGRRTGEPRAPTDGAPVEGVGGGAGVIRERIEDARLMAFVDPAAARALTQGVSRLQAQPEAKARALKATEEARAKAVNTAQLPQQIISHLGLPVKDSRKKQIFYSQNTLADQGIRIGTKEERVQLRKEEGATRSSMKVMKGIIRRVRHNPKILSLPGAVATMFINTTSAITGLADLVSPSGFIEPGAVRRTLNDMPILGNLAVAAEDSRILKQQIIDLTFKAGGLSNQVSGRMTNQKYENIARQLATATADPDIMIGVLRSFAMTISNTFNTQFRNVHGNLDRFVGLPFNLDNTDPFGDMNWKQLSGIIPELLIDSQAEAYEFELRGRLEELGSS